MTVMSTASARVDVDGHGCGVAVAVFVMSVHDSQYKVLLQTTSTCEVES